MRRKLIALRGHLRMASIGVRATLSPAHPILAHIVPMRRCNLACAYCNEYDDHSPPVPTSVMASRLSHLAGLGTSMVAFSGGEPLLHPDLDELVVYARSRGMLTELLTNGYLLTRERIARLNEAGLCRLQISVDNVVPDEVSKKSLKVLDKKLAALAEVADFEVNVNSVLGGGARAQDALVVARRARDLGLTTTVGILHDGDGQLVSLSEEEIAVYREIVALSSRLSMGGSFRENLVRGQPNRWQCRAGARYLYVCEEGLVHYCSQQRGVPGIPLLEYTRDHVRREFYRGKSCAPMCTVSCAHAVAALDSWRPQGASLPEAPVPHAPTGLVQLRR